MEPTHWLILLASYERALAARGYLSLAQEALDAVAPVAARLFSSDEDGQLVVLAHEHEGQTLVSAFRVASNGYVSLPL